MKIRIDGTPEEIEQAAHIFGPSCGPIKLTEAARIAEYEWTDKAHGSLSDALACLAVQKYVDAEWRRLRGPEGIQMLYPNFRF